MNSWIVLQAIGIACMAPAHSGLQQTGADDRAAPHCGVACVFALLQSYGKGVSLAEVEARFRELYPGVGTERLHLGQLREVLGSFGVRARTFRGDIRSGALPTPAVLFLGRDRRGEKMPVGHFVFLRRAARSQVEVADAGLPPRVQWVSVEELARFSDGQMLAVDDGVRFGMPTVARVIAIFGLIVSAIGAAVRTRRGHGRGGG